jgi:TusA-related sulfurtransferase
LSKATADLTVDTRDQPCPAPLLLVKKAWKSATCGLRIEVVTNDRTSRDNVLSFCLGRGDALLASWASGSDLHILFEKSTP